MVSPALWKAIDRDGDGLVILTVSAIAKPLSKFHRLAHVNAAIFQLLIESDRNRNPNVAFCRTRGENGRSRRGPRAVGPTRIQQQMEGMRRGNAGVCGHAGLCYTGSPSGREGSRL